MSDRPYRADQDPAFAHLFPQPAAAPDEHEPADSGVDAPEFGPDLSAFPRSSHGLIAEAISGGATLVQFPADAMGENPHQPGDEVRITNGYFQGQTGTVVDAHRPFARGPLARSFPDTHVNVDGRKIFTNHFDLENLTRTGHEQEPVSGGPQTDTETPADARRPYRADEDPAFAHLFCAQRTGTEPDGDGASDADEAIPAVNDESGTDPRTWSVDELMDANMAETAAGCRETDDEYAAGHTRRMSEVLADMQARAAHADGAESTRAWGIDVEWVSGSAHPSNDTVAADDADDAPFALAEESPYLFPCSEPTPSPVTDEPLADELDEPTADDPAADESREDEGERPDPVSRLEGILRIFGDPSEDEPAGVRLMRSGLVRMREHLIAGAELRTVLEDQLRRRGWTEREGAPGLWEHERLLVAVSLYDALRNQVDAEAAGE